MYLLFDDLDWTADVEDWQPFLMFVNVVKFNYHLMVHYLLPADQPNE